MPPTGFGLGLASGNLRWREHINASLRIGAALEAAKHGATLLQITINEDGARLILFTDHEKALVQSEHLRSLAQDSMSENCAPNLSFSDNFGLTLIPGQLMLSVELFQTMRR